MSTTVIFDTALLADAVNRASRVAPTKGAGFDKAGGIHIEVNPATKVAYIRATDLNVTFEQRVPIMEGKGNPVAWRIPSSMLNDLISSLPTGDGNNVEFIDRDDTSIRIKMDKMLTKVQMFDATDYPLGVFKWSSDEFVDAADLAYRVDQVAWGVDRKSPTLGGVHLDGDFMYGCNQQVLAVIPAKVGLNDPVTVPLDTLVVLLKGASACRVRADDTRFFIELDEHTRVTTSLIATAYPNVKGVMRNNFIGEMKIHRQAFIDKLDRMMVIGKQEKLPTLTIRVNCTGMVPEVVLDMEVPSVGRMQDSMDVTTDFDSEWQAHFVPRFLMDAAQSCKGDFFTLSFGHESPEKTDKMPVLFTDNKQYTCYVMPKHVQQAAKS